MHTCPDCLPCILKQVNNVAKEANASAEQIREMLIRTSKMLPALDLALSPAHNSTIALRLIPELCGVKDPYEKKKSESNSLALELLPAMQKLVAESADKIRTAALVAAAGNVIDLAIQGNEHAGLEGVLKSVIADGFAVDHSDAFKKALVGSQKIVYLGDNAGELVFDREFARILREGGRQVVFAVHGGPILNDALIKDAQEAGLTDVVEVMSTGSDWIGLELETCTPEFRKVFREADLVIAKGHGNYETVGEMAGAPAETYFILRAKCASVASLLGVRLGQVVFKRK
jgi:uncharacterized protein with ATP-grasp and redox domains